MATKKTTAKTETKATEVKETAKATTKTAAAKTTTAAKAEAKPATKAAAKTEEKAAPEQATAAAKKPAAKKTTTAKEAKTSVYIEFNGAKVAVDEVVENVKATYKANGGKAAIKTLEVYVKPEEQAAYFVVNGELEGNRMDVYFC